MRFKAFIKDGVLTQNILVIPFLCLILFSLISVILAYLDYNTYDLLKSIFICLSIYYLLLGLIIGINELKIYINDKVKK